MDAPLDDPGTSDGDLAIESLGSAIAGLLVIAMTVTLPYLAAFALYRALW